MTDELCDFSCSLFLTLQVKGEDNAYMEIFAKFLNLLKFLTANLHTLIKPEIYVVKLIDL